MFTPTSREWLARVALGLGATQHTQGPAPGEVGRKGMSCERTFRWVQPGRRLGWGVGLIGGASMLCTAHLITCSCSHLCSHHQPSRARCRNLASDMASALRSRLPRCWCRPLDRRAELEGKLREVAEHLAGDMAREGLKAKAVMLKVKLANFEVGPGWGGQGAPTMPPRRPGACACAPRALPTEPGVPEPTPALPSTTPSLAP